MTTSLPAARQRSRGHLPRWTVGYSKRRRARHGNPLIGCNQDHKNQKWFPDHNG